MYKANIIKVRLLMLVLCGAQCSLFGMLSTDKDDNQNLILDLIVKYGVSHDDYDAHRKIALLNTTHNKLIEDTYRFQKKLIEKYIQENKENLPLVTGARSWNKGFNACAWVDYDDNFHKKKDLQLTLINAVHNEIITKSVVWSEFYFPIFEDDVRPFFDKDGRACFYGVGKGKNKFYSLIEYCLDLDKVQKPYLCSYTYFTANHPKYGNSTITQPMLHLLNFPVLLKAFLQSKKSVMHDECCRRSESNDPEKRYHITGITLPENYKTYKKCMALEQYGLFAYDSLEDDLIKVLDDHYEKQQREKCIEDFIRSQKLSVTGSQVWNKDFSTCAWVTFDNNSSDVKDLQLTMVGLVDNGKRVVRSSHYSWHNFYFPVFEDDVRPWFDKDGRAYFYGYVKIEDEKKESDEYYTSVGEYSIDLDGTAEHYQCICNIHSSSFYYDSFATITKLLNFPVLMKALLLQSKIVDKRKFDDGYKKAYYPDPTHFPENYKMYKKHVALAKMEEKWKDYEDSKYRSYGDLPMSLQSAFRVDSW